LVEPHSATTSYPLRVLLVEHEVELAATLAESFVQLAPDGDIEVASTLAGALDALRAGLFDVILLDLELPDSQGLDTFRAVRSCVPDAAIVVIGDGGDASLPARAAAEGAQDYLVKGSFSGEMLLQVVRLAVERQRRVFDLSRRREHLEARIARQSAVETALRDAESRLSQVIARSPAVLYTLTPGGAHEVTWMSDNSERILGYPPERFRELPDLWYHRVHPEDLGKLPELAGALARGEDVAMAEYRFQHGDGRWLRLADTLSRVRGADGSPLEIVGACQDVTAERELEEQFRQAQKMEAVGQLAGGVAHDFNNLLTAIGGYSELLLRRLGDADPARREVEEIRRAAEQATTLTRQLLAYSRRQAIQSRLLDVNAVLADTERMLRRLIGENVRLVTAHAPGELRVKVDPGQLEQVVVNLAVNARDAMAAGGQLTIATGRATIGDPPGRHPEARPGSWVVVSVADTGEGMTPEVLSRIFEPFFTTKEKDKGTGLGLSTVYGIVRQSGGWIEVASEPGAGTTFTVFLPEAAAEVPSAAPPAIGDLSTT